MKRARIVVVLSLFSIVSQAQNKATPVPAKVSGKDIYTIRCMTCHQVDGTGAQNMIPPLTKTTYILGNKEKLIKIILNGLNQKMEVNGEIYEGEMPPLSILTDKEIAAVLTYVRTNFGNKAGAVTTAEVKKVRATNKK